MLHSDEMSPNLFWIEASVRLVTMEYGGRMARSWKFLYILLQYALPFISAPTMVFCPTSIHVSQRHSSSFSVKPAPRLTFLLAALDCWVSSSMNNGMSAM